MVEFDLAKDAANRARHGLSLARATDMDMDAAMIEPDDRFAYGEERWIAYGPIDDRLHVLVFSPSATTPCGRLAFGRPRHASADMSRVGFDGYPRPTGNTP